MTRDFTSFAVSEGDYWYVGHNEITHWLLRLSLLSELGQLSVLGSHNLVIGMTWLYCSRFCFCFAFFFFFWPCHMAWISIPWQGSNLVRRQWQCQILTTGPSGTPLFFLIHFLFHNAVLQLWLQLHHFGISLHYFLPESSENARN